MNKLLEIKNLHTHFKTDFGILKALDGVNFSIERGKIQGIVGESGCGKSLNKAVSKRITFCLAISGGIKIQ